MERNFPGKLLTRPKGGPGKLFFRTDGNQTGKDHEMKNRGQPKGIRDTKSTPPPFPQQSVSIPRLYDAMYCNAGNINLLITSWIVYYYRN